MSMRDEETLQLIRVEIFDTHSSSTILKVYPTTTTSSVCDAIGNKIDVSPDSIKFYNLILVVSWTKQSNFKKYSYVRTLKPSELVISVYQSVMEKIEEKFANGLSPLGYHSKDLIPKLPTLSKLNDDIYDHFENLENRIVSARWYYKDMRTTPLDCNHQKDDINANSSSSEDEEEIPVSDFTYLTQIDRKGYLLRRSKRDPNLWRKRLCILVDNFWCVDTPEIAQTPRAITRRKRPKATNLKIDRNFKFYDSVQGFDYPHCIALQSQGTGTSQTVILRASSQQEQKQWVADIVKRITINTENQAICMAEIIMSDDVSNQSDKLSRDIFAPMSMYFNAMNWDESTDGDSQQYQTTVVEAISSDALTLDRLRDQRRLTNAESIINLEELSAVDPVVSNTVVANAVSNKDGYSSDELETIQKYSLSLHVNAKVYVDEEEDDFSISSPTRSLRGVSMQQTRDKSSPFSLLTQLTLNLRIHRSPTYSIIHQLHQKHPIIYQMLMFVSDVYRYKQFHRFELFPVPRSLWVKILIIYHKYLAYQISLTSKPSFNDPSVVSQSEKSSNNRPVPPSRGSESNLKKSSSSVKIPTQRPVVYQSNLTICDWRLSSTLLIQIQKRIFSNVRRQIAGFDLPSMKLVSLTDPTIESESIDENRLLSPPQTTATSPLVISNTNRIISPSGSTVSNADTSSSNLLSWLFGSNSLTESINEGNNHKGPNTVPSDQYVSYDEIYGAFPSVTPSLHSTLLRSESELNNKPVFQIRDLNDLPPVTLFDDLVAEVVQKIEKYFSNL